MARKSPQLAKLTRPRLRKAVARERLFELLDERREHAVVWIVGPPGAGKTTLAASYLEEAGVPAIWYQIDPGDSDPATFFYYLKHAIEAVGKKKAKPLPLLTPEYLPDLPGFARRFMRDGFARLPDEFIFVFDNYHDIAASSALHASFKAALAEVPPGSNIFVLSRSSLPPAFADAFVNQTIALVSWEDLRLTAEETTAIATSRGITDGKLLRILHEQSSGWMAGVTLMLEHLRRGGSLETLLRAHTLDTVFDYFAGLIFDQASDQTREVLMKTAFLPRMSAALIEVVTGKVDAIEHIEELYRRHLFTDRNAGDEITYQYHALFRAFLKSRASLEYSADSCRSIARRAATMLQSQGHPEPAFALFVEAEEWSSAEQVVIALAPQLLSQGRWQTLVQLVEALPQSRFDLNPWLRYWLGRSRTVESPVSGRAVLETAYQDFYRSGDEIGQLLCATTILEGLYFELDDLRAMDQWIACVASLLQRGARAPTKEDELRANSVLMMGAAFRAPLHSMVESCLRRVEQLLKEPFDANLKVAAACMLHCYANVAMDPEAERIANLVAQPLLSSPNLSTPYALRYWHAEGYTHYLHGRYTQALAIFHSADTIARELSFPDISYWWIQRGLCERRAGLLDQAEETIHRLESATFPAGEHFHGGLYLLKASVAFDRGDLHQAIEHILRSYRSFDKVAHFNGKVLVGTVASNMAIAGSRFDVASQILGRLRGEEYGSIAENYLAAIGLNEAWLAHRRGDFDRRNESLREALLRSADGRARERLRWYPNAMTELLPVAFDLEIEPEIASQLAREFNVVPAANAPENWPWPVKVYTLGRFELLIDGRRPEYSRKVPKKVLALLKAIIAQGGKDVPEQKLIDTLWSDEEGDAARRALVTTLHRLRKLLGHMKAIQQTGGELSLDEGICWIDARAFERCIDGLETGQDGPHGATRLYLGAFLHQDEGASWTIPTRERLRDKFIRAVGKFGEALENSDQYEAAIDLYSRGIHADPLIEPFYQGLMRCYDKLNRRAEAASAYRRLRETLSIVLGVTPSSASQRLFESLRLS